jgi:hypothetical protein
MQARRKRNLRQRRRIKTIEPEYLRVLFNSYRKAEGPPQIMAGLLLSKTLRMEPLEEDSSSDLKYTVAEAAARNAAGDVPEQSRT